MLSHNPQLSDVVHNLSPAIQRPRRKQNQKSINLENFVQFQIDSSQFEYEKKKKKDLKVRLDRNILKILWYFIYLF